MDFEYDPDKSQSNQEKHGIDFEEAQRLWVDEDGLEIPAICEIEPRFARFAMLDGKVWAAFFTMRGETIRIISVRRARTKEVELYDSGTIG